MKDLKVFILCASNSNIQAHLSQSSDYSVFESMSLQLSNIEDVILSRLKHLMMNVVFDNEIDISIVQEHNQATREIVTE